jgi:hypothetical protein
LKWAKLIKDAGISVKQRSPLPDPAAQRKAGSAM